jgi:HlyD family secretion protein
MKHPSATDLEMEGRASCLSEGRTALPCLVILLAMLGCQKEQAASSTTAGPKLTLIRPESRSLQKVVEQPGRIEGFEQTPLYSKLPGYVKTVHADIGDVVTAGKVLAELNIPEIEEELKQKDAAVGLAVAQVEQARKSLMAAKANVEKADANIRQAEASKVRALANLTRWKSELQRQRGLVGTGAIAQSEFEITTDAFRAAEAAVSEAEASIDLSKAARTATQAESDKAEAQVFVALAQQQLSEADRRRVAALLGYTRIVAPFNGIVTRRQVDTGHFVQPPSGTTATSVQPLFHVVRTDLVRIYVNVPEVDAPYVEKGMAAIIRIQALQERELRAPVVRVSWALETITRTLRAEIDLPNAEGRLRPGMYVTAQITMTRDKVLTIPTTALAIQNEQPYVVMVRDKKAQRIKVRLGLRTKGYAELLSWQEPAKEGATPTWKPFTGNEELVGSNIASVDEGQVVAK